MTVVVMAEASPANAISGERVWWDGLYVGTDPTGTYFDGNTPGAMWNGPPNASTSTRLADEVNQVTNPNVELNSEGWYTNDPATSSFVRSTTSPISGSASMMSTRTPTAPDTCVSSNYIGNAGGDTGIPVVVGQTYTVSIDVKSEQDNRRAVVYFSWYDDAWAGKGNSSDFAVWTNLVNGAVTRISHTATVPAGATKCLVITAVYTIGGTGNSLTGERAWYDNLRLSEGSTGTDYFDGSSPGWVWSGTPHQSTSNRPLVYPYSQWDGSKAIPLNGAWQTDAVGALVPAGFAEVEVV